MGRGPRSQRDPPTNRLRPSQGVYSFIMTNSGFMKRNEKYTVVYTDPNWALGTDGRVDPSLATLEQEVLGDGVELRFGSADNGHYSTSGPKFESVLAGADGLVISRCS